MLFGGAVQAFAFYLLLPGWPPRKPLIERARKKGLGGIQGLRGKRKREGLAQAGSRLSVAPSARE